jgi:hypothetical protein
MTLERPLRRPLGGVKDAQVNDVVLGSVGAGSIDAQLPAAFNTYWARASR